MPPIPKGVIEELRKKTTKKVVVGRSVKQGDMKRTVIDIGNIPQWSDRKVKITTDSNKNPTVLAKCTGPFAVHRCTDEDGWCVTSVPTGYRICLLRDQDEATQISIALWRDKELRSLFSSDVVTKIQRSAPPWLKPWLKKCEARRKFMDPKPFKLKYGTAF